MDIRDTIIDHKTTKRASTPAQVSQDLQLTAYSLAHHTTLGKPESSLRLDVAVRTKTPKILHLETTRKPHDHTRFLKLLGYVAKGIQSNLFYPNPNFPPEVDPPMPCGGHLPELPLPQTLRRLAGRIARRFRFQ